MKSTLALAVFVGCTAAAASAQSPSSAFDRGKGQQAWQNPGLAAVPARCATRPRRVFRIGGGEPSPADLQPPPDPPTPPPSSAIPGVIAAGQTWKVVWHWQGNNADGPIAGDDGKMLFANNDASNVMEIDPATGPCPNRSRRRQHGRRRLAQQERRAVRRFRRGLGRRHHAARAAAQDAREHVQRRAARLHRRRAERLHAPTRAAASISP